KIVHERAVAGAVTGVARVPTCEKPARVRFPCDGRDQCDAGGEQRVEPAGPPEPPGHAPVPVHGFLSLKKRIPPPPPFPSSRRPGKLARPRNRHPKHRTFRHRAALNTSPSGTVGLIAPGTTAILSPPAPPQESLR